jgi:hypothetical protein
VDLGAGVGRPDVTDLAERLIASVGAHRAVRSIRLGGSRAEGRATDKSDWDFLVEANDFPAVAEALPTLLAPLEPLVQQWDRLSPEWCWMLVLRGPTKVDLIFTEEPHVKEPPWEPSHENLEAIEAHFWDWMLWLRSKEAGGKAQLVEGELDKLFNHLLAPLGATRRPSSVHGAIATYRASRRRAEQRFGVVVNHALEDAVAHAFEP